MVTVVNIQVLL